MKNIFYAQISERDFTSQIIALARWHKWKVVHFRPGMDRRGKWSTPTQGDVGFPDCFLLRQNRALLVELKSAKGKPSPEQEEWLEMAKRAGLEAYLWKPKMIEQIEEILK